MSELDYDLPGELVAVRPAEPRDGSRLMVVRRGAGEAGGVGERERGRCPQYEHRRFYEIGGFLRAGDLLVVNDTRVVPAKLGLRRKSGAAIGGLFVREVEVGRGGGVWEVMLRTRGKVRVGEELLGGEAGGGYGFVLEERLGEGLWRVRVLGPGGAGGAAVRAGAVLEAIGHVPLPPYIVRQRKHAGGAEEVAEDRGWYQTVYAHGGAGESVAAPTAGLHFTPELLARLEGMGVRRVAVELEVGLGTFLPVDAQTLEEHVMHRERYVVPGETVAALRAARGEGRRIVVVGTTAVRTLEAAASLILDTSSPPTEIRGETDLKIGPGYGFRLTDVLVTNFHLPRSTLMALVAAFLGEGGVERLRELYGVAVREGYRFYSYGDAMMVE